MEERDFREAVRSGFGRGILYARDHDVGQFRDIILDACMHCYSADPQTEGTRAPYMLELTDTMPDREFYRNEVLKSLSVSQDDWDTVQRFRIASYLAMDGDDRARRAMYENFDPGPKLAEETCIDFLRMDGLDGFLFAAGMMGKLLTTNAGEVNEGRLFYHATETFGEQEAFDALRKAGEMNEWVET